MKTNFLSLAFNQMFPLSTEKGGDSSGINRQKMRLLSEHGLLIKQDQVLQLMEKHHEFLSNGGAGGQWKSLQVGGLVIGFYDWKNIKEGAQAVFERMNVTKVNFKKLELPFANFCGIFGKGTDFGASNLSHSLFTDSTLKDANFEGAYLKRVDFSRSNLRGTSFVNAKLSGADFENCDLSNADFTGAQFETARFPGALLDGVKY